jgi:hypothetical protein
VLDHRRERQAELQQERERPKVPAPALQFGTLGWASAVGNQAVARIARQPVEEAEAPGDELEPAAMEPEAGEAAEMIPDELPDELPE